MPELRLTFPVVLRSREDELTLAVALGIPECSVADCSADAAVAGLAKQLVGLCEKLLPEDLLSRLVKGVPQLDWITLHLRSPNRSLMWREELQCPLAVVRHQMESGLHCAYIPALQLTSVTDNSSQLEDLVRRQVIAALRRENKLTVAGVDSLGADQISIREIEFSVRLKTPKELLSAERLTDSGAVQSLKKYAIQLHPHELTSIEHRDETVRQLAECLREPHACSVLLVGPPGVGKTAVFKELARRHNELGFASKTFWMTEGSAIVAGATGFGMWQQRCDQLLEGVRHRDGIVHLGNLFELSEAGRINGSQGVAAHLSGPMRSGRLIGLAECTEQQYAMLERQDPGVTSCFERIVLEPTTEEQTRDILLKESVLIEARTNVSTAKKRASGSHVTVAPEAIQVLDRLHRRFTSEVVSPGRPLQWLRQWADELHQAADSSSVLDTKVVTERFSATSGLPHFLIDPNIKPDLQAIADRLRGEVIGQDEVIETLVGFVATLAADLQRPNRPLASLLLIGPTGVGKTETAKALARLMYNDASRMSRIDMSEFCTPGSSERLIGGVGHDGDGALTGAVRRQPFSVLLLDEIEKAHHSVFDILLQVLGEARLTDHRGRTASFANCIVLMTSNLGADTFRPQAMGLAADSSVNSYASHFDRSVRNFFRPEFYNRIDRILSYRPLPMEIVQQIARRRIEAVSRRAGLRERGVDLELNSEVVNWLSQRGYQPEYGARPLVRAIERDLVIPVSEQLTSRRLSNTNLTIELPAEREANGDQRQSRPSADQLQVKPDSGHQDDIHQSRRELELCRHVSKFRRMGQAMKRTTGYRNVEYQATQVTRQIARMDSQPTLSDFLRQRLDQLKAEQRVLQERLSTWDQLLADFEAAEDRVLLAFYRRQAIEIERETELQDELRSRLWNVLMDMLQGNLGRAKTAHLFVLGPQPHVAQPLIRAYIATAKAWGASAKLKWLRAAGSPLPDSWRKSVDPKPAYSFVERESFSLWKGKGRRREPGESDTMLYYDDEAKNQTSGGKVSAVIDAWSCTEKSSADFPPPDSLGVMLTISSSPLNRFMRNEVGMHVFRPEEYPDGKRDLPFLVEYHEANADYYEVPQKLAVRKVEPLGDLRRHYNLADATINDVALRDGFPIGTSVENSIQELIEKHLEVSVWEQLE